MRCISRIYDESGTCIREGIRILQRRGNLSIEETIQSDLKVIYFLIYRYICLHFYSEENE